MSSGISVNVVVLLYSTVFTRIETSKGLGSRKSKVVWTVLFFAALPTSPNFSRQYFITQNIIFRGHHQGLPRQGSCNRGHPTQPVEAPYDLWLYNFLSSLFLRTFPEKVSDPISRVVCTTDRVYAYNWPSIVHNRQSICLQLSDQ